MNLGQVENFLLVVEKGSLSQAAEESFISPQAMVQQMNALEAEIGVKLLDRSPRGVKCTPAGQFLYEKLSTLDKYFQDVLDECRRIGKESLGLIRVGRSTIPVFEEVAVPIFLRSRPTASVEYVETEMDSALGLLIDKKIDVIEVESAPSSLPEGLAFEGIAFFSPMCVVSSDNPLAAKELIGPDDLKDCRVGTRDGRLAHDGTKDDWLGNVGCFEQKPLSKNGAIEFCLNGGALITLVPGTSVVFPLVAIPYDHDRVEAGLLVREGHSPAVDMFVETARGCFDSQGTGDFDYRKI